MSEVKLTTRKIKAQDVEIFATDSGTFVATVNGERVEKDTLQQLVDRVDVLLAVKLKPVEVTLLERPSWHSRDQESKFRTVKLVGIHSGNGNLLINGGGATQQLCGRDGVYLLLDAKQQAEYFRLEKAKVDAYEAFDKWRTKHILTDKAARKLLKMAEPKTAGVE